MPSAFDNNSNEVECIRCGQCADVCPSQLLPQELQWSAKAKDHDQQLMQVEPYLIVSTAVHVLMYAPVKYL